MHAPQQRAQRRHAGESIDPRQRFHRLRGAPCGRRQARRIERAFGLAGQQALNIVDVDSGRPRPWA